MSDPHPPLPEPFLRARCGPRPLWVPLFVIALGVVFLLDQFGIYSADRLFAFFWPAVFIVIGAELLTTAPGRGTVPGVRIYAGRNRALCGAASLLLGIGLALRALGVLHFDPDQLWPLALIAVGVLMLLQVRGRSSTCAPWGWPGWGSRGDSAEPQLEGYAVLGGVTRRVTARDFTSGHLYACFGGFQVDLRDADIAGDTAIIEAHSLFGGGEIRVPQSWLIDLQGHALLGGYADETRQVQALGPAKRLVIRGSVVLGGIVVKN